MAPFAETGTAPWLMKVAGFSSGDDIDGDADRILAGASTGANNIATHGAIVLSVAETTLPDGAIIASTGWIGIGNSLVDRNGGNAHLTADVGAPVNASDTALGGAERIGIAETDDATLTITGAGTMRDDDGGGCLDAGAQGQAGVGWLTKCRPSGARAEGEIGHGHL